MAIVARKLKVIREVVTPGYTDHKEPTRPENPCDLKRRADVVFEMFENLKTNYGVQAVADEREAVDRRISERCVRAADVPTAKLQRVNGVVNAHRSQPGREGLQHIAASAPNIRHTSSFRQGP